MASETLGWWLGAAPGFVIALRTWWQGLRLQSRLSAAAVAERKWAAAELSNHQKVNLWFAPHRFISPDDTWVQPPFSRTLTRRPIKAMRSVHVKAQEVHCRVQAWRG
ncbi:hypothetical protein XAB3213_300018 [Xanthomonas citri pv. bilvae]|nr:hypothetical protein XAB3213_300018 [Xanthomonas citri pv. bilvae]